MSSPQPDNRKRPFKRRLEFKRRSKKRQPGDAHTILSFCESNAISPSKYYALKRQDRGPREIELDGRIIISPEAEIAWRRQMEAETAAKRQRERARSKADSADTTAT